MPGGVGPGSRKGQSRVVDEGVGRWMEDGVGWSGRDRVLRRRDTGNMNEFWREEDRTRKAE